MPLLSKKHDMTTHVAPTIHASSHRTKQTECAHHHKHAMLHSFYGRDMYAAAHSYAIHADDSKSHAPRHAFGTHSQDTWAKHVISVMNTIASCNRHGTDDAAALLDALQQSVETEHGEPLAANHGMFVARTFQTCIAR